MQGTLKNIKKKLKKEREENRSLAFNLFSRLTQRFYFLGHLLSVT